MNYASLKTSISDWVARGDLAAGVIDDIIDLAEAQINRELRVRAMEAVFFRALDSDARVPVPTGYREFKSVYLYSGTGVDDTLPSLANSLVSGLESTDINSMLSDFNASNSAAARIARAGGYFYVGGKPEGTYSVGGVYYKTFTPLSDADPSNWLTDYAADLLLAACMKHTTFYTKAFDQAKMWEEQTAIIIDKVMTEEKKESMSGAMIVTRSGVRGA